MTSILVVDDMPIFREPIAAALRGAGYQALTAANGKEALARLQSDKIDVLLLDVAMPIMDGITCLGAIRNNPATRNIPVILLTAVSEKPHILAAARFGVQDYLLKSRFSLQELLTRIEKCVNAPAPSSPTSAAAPSPAPPSAPAPARTCKPAPPPTDWPKLFTRDQTLARLDEVAGGKTIAGVVAQVISLASSPHTDLPDIVRLINTDPILASRILQLANSPAFLSNRGRVSTVEDAARNVGVRSILNLALAIGIFGAFPPDEADGFNSMRCWQHSFAVADIMTLFVSDKDPLQEGMTHLVGLCHDLGEILLRQHFASAYATILDFAAKHHLPVHAIEGTALGIRHPELISRLLSRIGLPQPVVHAIREFYERQVRDQAAGMSQLARGLLTANQIAHGLLLAASPQESVAPITRTEWQLLAGDKSVPTIDPVAKRTEILAATNILARLPIKDEQRLVTPILSKHNCRVLYLRARTPSSTSTPSPAPSPTCPKSPSCPPSPLFPTSPHSTPSSPSASAPARPLATPAELLAATRAAGIPEMPILLLTSQGDPLTDLPPHVTHRRLPCIPLMKSTWLAAVTKSRQTPVLQGNQ